VELAVVAAADHDSRALGNRVVEVLTRPREDLRRAERAHVGLLVERVADAERLRALGKSVEELALHGLVDEDALRGRAALAGQVEAADDGGVGGLRDVRVREHDLRPVAAELEHTALERGVARDLLARARGAREDDGADVRMANELRADVTAAVHDVEGAGREAGVVDDLGEHVGAEGRVLRRLPDGRATDGESVDDGDPGDVDREVPGRDRGDDADRLLDDDDALRVRALLRRGKHLAGMAQNVLGGATEVVGRVLDHLLTRLADRLPDFAGDHLGDLVGALRADRERRAAELDPLQQRDLAPGLESLGGSRYGGIHLGR
jgi:hypothetical protein